MTARRFCASAAICRERCGRFSETTLSLDSWKRIQRDDELAQMSCARTGLAAADESEQERGERRCIGSLKDGR